MDKVDSAVAETPAPVLEGEAGLRPRYFGRKKEIAGARYVGPGFVFGVPARDLSAEEWIGLSDEQRAAAVQSKTFVVVKEGE